MSGDSWEDRRKAQEESYFEKENALALQRISKRPHTEPRKSPITGKPMEQITVMGVVVDRCPDSGGVWLDNGELEEIMKHAQGGESKMTSFFSKIFSKPKGA